ncbi:MAG: hypothetical protein NTV29_03965 [Planctomycetota bacterium]|nr:hypothetical protein [Planctomycetota bacterium]
MDWPKRVLVGWVLLVGFKPGALLGQELVPASAPSVCVVLGAPGEPLYGKLFQEWAQGWTESTRGTKVQWVGRDVPAQGGVLGGASDREMLKEWIERVEHMSDEGTYWLVMMGHGTHDGKTTKFNMRGADVSAQELGQWLSGSKHRWVIAVCGSSSGPFLAVLSNPKRVVITSTKSGSESNFSRFGGFFAQSISDPASDLDHDHAISVLEAFVSASRKTDRYYEDNKLLATEHAILDDNGDGKGTPADFYRGLRRIKRPENGIVDGELARLVWLKEPIQREGLSVEQSNLIGQLEKRLEDLRAEKNSIEPVRYYEELEKLFSQIAEILYPPSK